MSRDLERLLREARSLLPDPHQRATRRARDAVLAPYGRRRRRWRFVALGGLLAVAVGIGVAAGLLGAPSGGAAPQNPFAGAGFLPAKGWTVVQASDGSRTFNAIAANVPLDARDLPPDGPPIWTISDLPPKGIVIFAVFYLQGRPATDAAFPERPLPFELADAYRETSWNAQIRPQDPIAQYRLGGAVAGYNADVHVYIGTLTPSRSTRAAAQRQLDRLVVAAEPVTIQLQPQVIPWAGRATLSGALASGRAGEEVVIEERRCGDTTFTLHVTLQTDAGGGFHTEFRSPVTTELRARWRNATSVTARLLVRPGVSVSQPARGRFIVGVASYRSLWGRRGVFERFDRATQRWVSVKTFTLNESGHSWTVAWAAARFRSRIPRGTLVRAVMPRLQVAPCYLAGYSNMLRTWAGR